MKLLSIGFLIFLIIAVFKTSDAQTSQYVSIKDFGAKGDGKTDDTKAIQAAIDYAQNTGFSQSSLTGVYDKNTIFFGAAKIIFFPTGIYNISKPLKAGSYIHFIGEKSVLAPARSMSNKFSAIEGIAWQANFEGLQFIAFKIALKLNNNNVDVGKIVINNCDFLNNETAIELNSKSAINIIRENRFYNNYKVLNIIAGDKVDMYDNWITSAALSGKYDAQIINRGILHFDKNLLVPVNPLSGAQEPAWINNYNLVTIDGVRQGGELGSFTLVNNFAEASTTYPVNPNGVVITNSDCYGIYGSTKNYKSPAALRLIGIPNNLVMRDLRGFTDAKLMDFTQLVSNRLSSRKSYTNKEVMVKIDNIQVTPFKQANGTDVPDELLNYLIK